MKNLIILIMLFLSINLTGCYAVDKTRMDYVELNHGIGVQINPVNPIFTIGNVGFNGLKDDRLLGKWYVGQPDLSSFEMTNDNVLLIDDREVGDWNYVTSNVFITFLPDNYIIMRIELLDQEGTMAMISISTAYGDVVVYGMKYVGERL